MAFPLQILCLRCWRLPCPCGFTPEGRCRRVSNLPKCFQIKTAKVLLYFPRSPMFRNKHWQCLFRAVRSISEHVSSMFSPKRRELATFGLWLEKCRLGNRVLKKGKKRELKPCVEHLPSALSLFLFPVFPDLQPLPRLVLSPTSLSGIYFFHTPPNPVCKNSRISLLFDGTLCSPPANKF